MQAIWPDVNKWKVWITSIFGLVQIQCLIINTQVLGPGFILQLKALKEEKYVIFILKTWIIKEGVMHQGYGLSIGLDKKESLKGLKER